MATGPVMLPQKSLGMEPDAALVGGQGGSMKGTTILGALLAALVGAEVACTAPTFVCGGHEDCRHGSVFGRCEATSFCSFPDTSCPSGQRYGELSADDLANRCVPGAAGDGEGQGDVGTSTGGGEGDTLLPTTEGSGDESTSDPAIPDVAGEDCVDLHLSSTLGAVLTADLEDGGGGRTNACVGSAAHVVHAWTAPFPGEFDVTVAAADFVPVLAVLPACGAPADVCEEGNHVGEANEEIQPGAGTTVLIVVGTTTSASGEYTILIEEG